MLTREQYLSGKVRRWHTHHGLDQTNADHSWGVSMVLLKIHPDPAPRLIRAALMHDCAEYLTGDIPGYAKQNFTHLKREADEAEKLANRKLGIDRPPLTQDEEHWLSLADAIEAIMFIRHCANLNDRDMAANFPSLLIKAQTHADHLQVNLNEIVKVAA